MKLIDNNGNIAVKSLLNGSITIDQSLPKYKKLEEVKQLKSDLTKIATESNSTPEGFSEFNYKYYESKPTEESIRALLTSDLHKIMSEETAENLNLLVPKTLLNQKGLNNDFNMLVGEVNVKYVRDITDSPKKSEKKVVEKVRNWLGDLITKKESEEVLIDVSEIFNLVKVETGKEREFIERVSSYVTLIKKSTAMHQTAQTEMLLKQLIIHIYESILSIHGLNKYVTVDNLIELQKKCDRKIDIDYLANFTRIIPDDVVKEKLRADNLLVFDNYMVLHYDPDSKSTAKTEAEIQREAARKRDPILFGLISGSNKLYFIADWVDELCDLTWDDIIKYTTPGELE